MAELMRYSPGNMILIFAIAVLVSLGEIWGWRYSIRIRRLVAFAAAILLLLMIFLLLNSAVGPKSGDRVEIFHLD